MVELPVSLHLQSIPFRFVDNNEFGSEDAVSETTSHFGNRDLDVEATTPVGLEL